jgi:methyl-accepting chemotaxis protein
MFRNRSLRFKIRLFVAFFLLLILGMGITMLYLARRYLREELVHRGEVIVRRLAESHSYQVSLGLADELEPILRRIIQTEEGIEYVEFVDAAGRIIHTSDGKYRAQSDSRRRPPQYENFNIDQYRSLSRKQGETIKGSDGKQLYDFYAPVISITGGADEISALDLSAVGEASPQKEAKVIGVVRMAVLPTTMDEAITQLRIVFLATIAVASLFGLAVAYFLTTSTTTSVAQVAEAASVLARGDLNQHVPAAGKDELGVLAQSFNVMADNLAKMIRRVRDAYVRVDQGREQIQDSTVAVMQASKAQVSSLEEVSSAISEMNTSLKGVAENVENLSSSAEETSSSIVEMASSIEEVSGHIKSLSSSVDETASSITEMVSSIQQVDHSVELLSTLITDTAASIKQMEGSIRQVEKNAASSQDLSEQVTANAEMGMKSVESTMGGMERARSSVHGAGEVIAKLGSSSEEIGKILNVIDDIAEQTNLLALNAAIIAAQAGEHGRGFAVVAEEIRELAERTASSTKEIDTLIKAVQHDVANAVQTMVSGSQIVEEGVGLSRRANENLKKILESARSSSDMSREIAKATGEQSKGIRSINQAIEQVREMMMQINKATTEQKAGSEQIISAVENMREMTVYVNRATVEQAKGSKQITEAMEHVTEMVAHIMKATSEQAKGSEQIVKIVEFFRDSSHKNLDSVAEMERALSLLMEQAGILKQEISIFKV